MMLIFIVSYQFVPSLQIYVDDSLHDWRDTSRAIHQFIDDAHFEVPDEAQPDLTVAELQSAREGSLRSYEWGNPSRNGPDRSFPDKCVWSNAMLYCSFHS